MQKTGLALFCGVSIFLLFSACNHASNSKSEKKGNNTVSISDSANAHSFIHQSTDTTLTDTLKNLATKQDSAEDNKVIDKDTSGLWPVKKPDLLEGALLPKNRIITFYGNLYAKGLGVLGEYPPDVMLDMLRKEIKKWENADPSTPVIPALDLITVTGQPKPGRDGHYRLRMPYKLIDSVLNLAKKIDAIVFLDIQPGQSTVQNEVPHYEKYLKMPNVHLEIDPEFYMKKGHVPGKAIGTIDASDINFCANYLKELVKKYNLPPKLLVIDRFTQNMLTGYDKVKLHPQVQIIINMDGWGGQALKRDTYKRYIYKEPIEYTGFKLFFKNDTWGGHKMMTPKEVLKLYPKPVYIQYQ